jgi:hypothetical protein
MFLRVTLFVFAQAAINASVVWHASTSMEWGFCTFILSIGLFIICRSAVHLELTQRSLSANGSAVGSERQPEGSANL